MSMYHGASVLDVSRCIEEKKEKVTRLGFAMISVDHDLQHLLMSQLSRDNGRQDYYLNMSPVLLDAKACSLARNPRVQKFVFKMFGEKGRCSLLHFSHREEM